jgi:hypothetical protein
VAEAAEEAGVEESVNSSPSFEPENVLATLVDKYYSEWMASKERYSEATK